MNNVMSENIQPTEQKKKTRKRRVKKRTLIEFKNWIDGMHEFEDEDWSPSSEQWNYIKDSIYAIIEEEYFDDNPVIQQPQSNNFNQTYQPPVIPQGSGLNNIHVSQPVGNIDNRLKQDIDTSDGQYKSEFE